MLSFTVDQLYYCIGWTLSDCLGMALTFEDGSTRSALSEDVKEAVIVINKNNKKFIKKIRHNKKGTS